MRGRAALVALVAVAAATATVATPAIAIGTAPAAANGAGTLGKVAGFGITTSAGGDRAVAESDRMAAIGVNTVSLEATWRVPAQDANEVHRGSTTISDEALLQAAAQVRASGMNVMLTTKVVCDCSPSWRGKLKPSNVPAFFASYRGMVNHYAKLAAQMGASMYFIGSEMNSLQGYAKEWRQVALEARSTLTQHGGKSRIGYQVNWDAIHEVRFWAELDISAISAYLPLSDALQPNVADLLEAWRSSTSAPWTGYDWYAQVRKFAQSHGKPVLFGEIGYQSAMQAARRPWGRHQTEGNDEQLQSDAYQAALTVFERESWWLGAIWWDWKLTAGGSKDLDYTVRGKLGEQLLTKWYAKNERPPTRTTSLVGVTRESSKGKPIPPESLTGPSSPDGRTSIAPEAPPEVSSEPAGQTAAARSAPTTAASPSESAAATASAAPLPTQAAPLLTSQAEEPPALAAVPFGTIEEALARARHRNDVKRGAVGAAVLLGATMIGHSLLLGRRVVPWFVDRVLR